MPLNNQVQPTTIQLSQAIEEMRDFLLGELVVNFVSEQKYNSLLAKINTLNLKCLAEGYVGYKNENPHQTLQAFMDYNSLSQNVVAYYSDPVFKKTILEKNAVLRVVDGTIKRIAKILPPLFTK